jgi:hypothetical protein
VTDSRVQHKLLASIAAGDVPEVHALLREGADPNLGPSPASQTPLIQAITANNLDIVRILIQAGADVNRAGKIDGNPPIVLARQNSDIVRELISAGVDLNSRTPPRELISVEGKKIRAGGETALHFAAAANDIETVKLLIEAGANIEAKAENGLTPLDRALKSGTPSESALLLIQAGETLTSERIDSAHGTSHRPDADLQQLPWAAYTEQTELLAEKLLGPRSCADEFRRRDRPAFWVKITLCIFGLCAMYLVVEQLGDITPLVFVPFLFFCLTFAWTAWKESNPICPNCKQNIKRCPSTYCAQCGKSPCECGSERPSLMMPILSPYKPEKHRYIVFCPGCSVHLDTNIRAR